jgi:hypothetical protein
MYPRATHSIGSIRRRRTSIPRSPKRSIRWLGTMSSVRRNQSADSAVRIAPLPGMGVGMIQS